MSYEEIWVKYVSVIEKIEKTDRTDVNHKLI